MDKKKAILNVFVSVICKVVLLIVSILVRRIFIKSLGMELNGLNSLFISIVGFLSVAELGVGSAITFCMYEPIVNGEKEKIAALYRLFKKAYVIIGLTVFILGLFVTPLLPYFIKSDAELNANIYLCFFIFLLSVVLGYGFNARLSLISAYKNNYASTAIQSAGLLFQYVLQTVALTLAGSLEIYFACTVIAALLQYFLSVLLSCRMHGDVIRAEPRELTMDELSSVKSNVKAMLMHKIGGALVNSTDNMIISAFVGVGVLGVYTNYAVIVNSVLGILTLAFSSLSSVIGHSFAASRDRTVEYYKNFYSANYALGVVFFLGFYAVSDYLVKYLFDTDEIMGRAVVYVMTLNYFIQFLRQSTLTFRDGTGTFYRDRYKPALEGGLNLILSIALAVIMGGGLGEEYGVIGVIIATVITNLLICHTVEPYVLFKYAFKMSVKGHLVKNYSYIFLFATALYFTDRLLITEMTGFGGLLVNGLISVGVAVAVLTASAIFDRDIMGCLTGKKQKS